ncbi:MAG: hypothetical protein J1E38_09850 [Paramuribaculum sp.]|nr:hypothetical protein [Paramuribaculum sp.]
MNDNIFSGKRLLAFFPIELICLQKRQLLYSLVMVGLLTLIALITPLGSTYDDLLWIERIGHDPVLDELLVTYIILMFCFGCLSASIMWSEMKDKQGRIYILMNPATIFEKFIVKFFVYVVCFLVVYILAVCFAETVRYLVYSNIYPEADVTPLYLSFSYPPETIDQIWRLSRSIEKPVLFFFCLYLMLQSFFVLGSSIWPSRSFIKTFLIFGCLTAAYFIIGAKTGSVLMTDRVGDPRWLRENSYAVYYTFTTIVTLVNWTLAYFRIPETDVITTKR